MPVLQIEQLDDIPILSPFADGTWWYLRAVVRWRSQVDGHRILLPAQFVTDLTSVPQPFRMVLPRWAKYGPAAIVHDWLYWSQEVSRSSADRFMLEEMRKAGVSRTLAWVMYVGLRLCGGFAWACNRRAKRRSDNRILEGLPESPYETWEQYQNRVWPRTI